MSGAQRTHQSSTGFRVLHAVAIKGCAGPEALARATGLDEAAVTGELGDLAGQGHVEERRGRVPGWALTPAGRDHHTGELARDRQHVPLDVVGAGYAAFLTLNQPFKQLCYDWQTGQDPVACIDRLVDIETAVQDVVRDLAGAADRMAVYGARFEDALQRVKAGDRAAFARPLGESFHDIWMELHEDLLQTLGRPRSSADE